MLTPMLHPMNIAAIYTAANARLPWTTEQLRPYVVHSYQDTTKPDTWFFDTFLLLDFKVQRGDSNAILTTSKDATSDVKDNNGNVTLEGNVGKMADWQHLIDSFFTPIKGNTESLLERLDACIAAAKLELGNPSFKHRVFLSIPEPISCFFVNKIRHYVYGSNGENAYTWGELTIEGINTPIIFHRFQENGDLDHVTSCDDCDIALKWFVEECLTAWNNLHLQNLELAGFHWIGEERPGYDVARNTLKTIGNYIRGKQNLGLSLSISFYYGVYKPNGIWNSNGQWQCYREKCADTYDYVFGQPNYSLGGGHEARTALEMYDVINQAQQYVNGVSGTNIKTKEGIVVEMCDDNLIAADNGSLIPSSHCRASFYLHALAGKNEMNLLYYTSSGLLAKAYDAATNANFGNLVFSTVDYIFFDHLADFVTNRRRTEALARVNIDQNNIVDIFDLNIVQNVMLGTDTDPDHVARADVNRDGVVDISDYNIVQSAMLGNLNL